MLSEFGEWYLHATFAPPRIHLRGNQSFASQFCPKRFSTPPQVFAATMSMQVNDDMHMSTLLMCRCASAANNDNAGGQAEGDATSAPGDIIAYSKQTHSEPFGNLVCGLCYTLRYCCLLDTVALSPSLSLALLARARSSITLPLRSWAWGQPHTHNTTKTP